MVPTVRGTALFATRVAWQSDQVDDLGVLRQMLRAGRREISPQEGAQRGLGAADQFARLIGPPPRALGSYFAADGELDPRPTGDLVEAAGGTVYLPVCGVDRLRFAAYQRDSALTQNRFSIPEPLDVPQVDPDELEVVLVPLVGFDRLGRRLGMGGGWYDRTFESRGATGRPVLVGFGHDEQELDDLSPQPWDVRMDAIVTPTRAWWTRPH